LNETEALTILAGIPNVGPQKFRQLLQRFGNAKTALEADSDTLSKIKGFGPQAIESWRRWKKEGRGQKELELIDKWGVQIVPFSDPRYPKRLKELPDAPPLLYVKGELKEEKRIAVVGTRKATIYGREMAEKISEALAASGWSVVSGLARGIDTAAHKAALRAGRSLAVIGSGIASLYPRENRNLAEEIARQGALISEFPMETPPERQNFPKRNRIVSGISEALLLIEAPIKSGAMITMRLAKKQGRKRFALPGRADCDNYAGNLLLLREGECKLVCSSDEILADLGEKKAEKRRRPQFSGLSSEEKKFMDQLPAEELTIDGIAGLTKLPMTKLHVLLTSLLLKRAIKKYPGNYYRKTD